jgi:hypothetical protein
MAFQRRKAAGAAGPPQRQQATITVKEPKKKAKVAPAKLPLTPLILSPPIAPSSSQRSGGADAASAAGRQRGASLPRTSSSGSSATVRPVLNPVNMYEKDHPISKEDVFGASGDEPEVDAVQHARGEDEPRHHHDHRHFHTPGSKKDYAENYAEPEPGDGGIEFSEDTNVSEYDTEDDETPPPPKKRRAEPAKLPVGKTPRTAERGSNYFSICLHNSPLYIRIYFIYVYTFIYYFLLFLWHASSAVFFILVCVCGCTCACRF